MRKFAIICSLLVFVACGVAQAVASDRIADVSQDKYLNAPTFLGYVPDRIIVVMKRDFSQYSPSVASNGVMQIGDPEFDRVSERVAASRIEPEFKGAAANPRALTAGLSRYYKVEFNAGTLDDAVAAYSALPNVERVEKIGIHAMCAVPNDTYYDPYQWYHNQASDHDIDSPEGWDIQTGDANRIIALLDSGTRYYHPDLGGANASPSNPGAARGNMWINDAELNGVAGVDDDGNGYTDDWIGYDFIDGVSNCWPGEDCNTKDNDPRDFNGHGTHTAGIMGMLTNDGYGMAGTAGGWGNGSQAVFGNGVKVMALRMGYSYNYLGQEYGVVMMDAAAEAFYYAANNGATIASCSWGSSNSGGIAAAADYFVAHGGLIFVAAGNDGTQTPGYLNSRSDCISVAATDQNDAAASFTTYGTWVDISAPGVGIYSTYHDHTDPNTNYWASLSGTSMATPMTAATAAMIWSERPDWSATQVEAQLYASADNIDAYLSPTYIGKMGAGRINLYNAVNIGTPCDVVADFSGTPTSGCASLTVNFTDLSTGTGIDSWSWDFGDGSGTSTAQNPSYTYTGAGTYTVTLTVNSSSQGCGDAQTRTNYITVEAGPTAGFTGSPTSGVEPLTVNFTDQSSGAASWSWDFGDGVGTSSAQNPSYTYTSAGTYTVTQTVTNACGSDQLVRTDYITVSPCVTPTAGFVGAPTSGDAPLTVNFTDQSTNASSWSWDFGDGVGTSTAQNPSYTYTSAGTYTVTQTVTNACGSDQLVRTNYITVTEPPAATDMYVFDLIVDRIGAGRGAKRGEAIVTIYDSNNQPVSGATVTGDFSGAIAESGATGVTNASGVATIQTAGTAKGGSGDECFEVTDVTHASFTYNSALNNVTASCEKAGDLFGTLGRELLTMPEGFALKQNHPNPFNPQTAISFVLAEPGDISLVVYNLLGREVTTLVRGHYSAGEHTVTWNAGEQPSGVYYYRLITNEGVQTRRMLLLK